MDATLDAARLPVPTDSDGDLVQPDHPFFGLIWANPERVSGTPCFAGTRVPVKIMFEYLEAGEPLDVFLGQFPSVTKAKAVAVLELYRTRLIGDLVPR